MKEERDLEQYAKVFADTEYWKKVGEEHEQALIVTGSVLFVPHARSGFVQREQEVYDSFGRRQVVPVRTYMERKGYILRPTFVFIDGRTGEQLYSESFREEILYNANQQTPALSSVLRADGPPAANLPEHPERAEDSRQPGADQVGAASPRREQTGRTLRVRRNGRAPTVAEGDGLPFLPSPEGEAPTPPERAAPTVVAGDGPTGPLWGRGPP